MRESGKVHPYDIRSTFFPEYFFGLPVDGRVDQGLKPDALERYAE